jgi:ketosteroid isomerase-like protein
MLQFFTPVDASPDVKSKREESNMSPGETDLADLKTLNARFIHNFVTRDVAGHDAILHPRFINISLSGDIWGKAKYLDYWATAFDRDITIYWDVRDQRIDIFGDVALVRAINKHIARRNGSDVTGMTAYTDTYPRESGSWLCIQAQLTTVAPENYPRDDTITSRYVRGELQKGS